MYVVPLDLPKDLEHLKNSLRECLTEVTKRKVAYTDEELRDVRKQAEGLQEQVDELFNIVNKWENR